MTAFPWRKRPTLYGVLVAEILLQHTPSPRVCGVYREIMARWPLSRDLATASVTDVERLLKPLGLQRRRARVLVTVATALTQCRRCHWSATTLRELHGVGPYTAGVTAAVVRRERVGFADGAIRRLIQRLSGARAVPSWHASADAVSEIVGTGDPRLLAWGLLDISREHCRVRPRCGSCPVRRQCAGYQQDPSECSRG